jgi:hypothetical protein
MQFTGDEWLEFAIKLQTATFRGRLRWTGSDQLFDPDSTRGFSTTVAGNATYRLRTKDGDEQFPYILTVCEPDGTVLADFVTVPYGDDWEQPVEAQASRVIAELYPYVERSVTGAPQKARSLLEGLDGLIADPPL